jgi:hypothetical protein
MVTAVMVVEAGRALVYAATSVDPVLEQLDPPRRAAVVMALLGLTLVGLFLITSVLVGGHWVRRMARHRPAGALSMARPATIGQLQDSLQATLADAKKGDTVMIDTRSKDTRVDG